MLPSRSKQGIRNSEFKIENWGLRIEYLELAYAWEYFRYYIIKLGVMGCVAVAPFFLVTVTTVTTPVML